MEVVHVVPQSRIDKQQLSEYLKKNSYNKATVNMEVYDDKIEFTVDENTRIWVWNLDK